MCLRHTPPTHTAFCEALIRDIEPSGLRAKEYWDYRVLLAETGICINHGILFNTFRVLLARETFPHSLN